MTKRERVIRAVRGEETDGIPSCFSMHFSPEYANGESAVDAHIQFLKQTDTDILKIMNENLVTCDHELITRQDYESFQKISAEQPFMKRQLDLVKRILEEADGQCFTIGTLHSVGT